MANCINCNRNVGCFCNLLEKKYCSQKCKDEYLNKENDKQSIKVLPELQQPEAVIEGDRYKAV